MTQRKGESSSLLHDNNIFKSSEGVFFLYWSSKHYLKVCTSRGKVSLFLLCVGLVFCSYSVVAAVGGEVCRRQFNWQRSSEMQFGGDQIQCISVAAVVVDCFVRQENNENYNHYYFSAFCLTSDQTQRYWVYFYLGGRKNKKLLPFKMIKSGNSEKTKKTHHCSLFFYQSTVSAINFDQWS